LNNPAINPAPDIQAALLRYQSAGESPARLHEAMHYATLNGGKRIRAALVYATGETLDCDEGLLLDDAACAVELIHAYSLVHDDLPCMDDDDLRRGKPTCHRAFDEATALLVGDALQALAFEILSRQEQQSEQRLKMIKILAEASSSRGMAGGQAIDLESVGQTLDLAQLEDMHNRKTGALILASVQLGGLAANADNSTTAQLNAYGRAIGLAFQVADDILDVEGDTDILGKKAGADAALGKPTYPGIMGLEQAKAQANRLRRDALESAANLGDNGGLLSGIANYIVERSN
jgi:geranylgeranyl pyrophosphate synthase